MSSSPAQLIKPEEMEMGLALNSQDHVTLFMHDEEVIRNFQSQVDLINKHVQILEEKLKVSNDECEDLRFRLYNCETTVLNERQGRTTFQRHFYVEQSRHSECQQSNHLLKAQHVRIMAEVDAACAFNAELRQEINQHEEIIKSLASKVAEYQEEALNLGPHWLGNREDSPTLGAAHDQGGVTLGKNGATPNHDSGVEVVAGVATTKSPKSADPTQWDKPARPSAIDIEVGRRGGSTIALDATAEAMQRAKKDPPKNLTERIEQLTRENGALRLQLEYHQKIRGPICQLRDDAQFAVDKIGNALVRFTAEEDRAAQDLQEAMEAAPRR
ncbi:hypothetical protein V496_01055 [Pseudogymnoascus sp. VKM F-4515 (FW-2607)]|nr:hypothetical protein V496_01055 [Pseudogymnoascus sp. VKM F-4515 (FW-2607)]KFY95944.1 hypothetical protein V498_03022 [Pseudogymnoascus sp. VKM F-4517 (FW-2822)]